MFDKKLKQLNLKEKNKGDILLEQIKENLNLIHKIQLQLNNLKTNCLKYSHIFNKYFSPFAEELYKDIFDQIENYKKYISKIKF